MADHNEIEEARKTLGLGMEATLNEIKSAYRRMAHCYHPDKHSNVSGENHPDMNKLNRAYKLLMEFCADYKISFREADKGLTDRHEDDMRKWREKWEDSI